MVLLSTPSVLCSLRQVLVLNELNRLTPAPCPQGLWSVSALVGMLDHAHVMQCHMSSQDHLLPSLSCFVIGLCTFSGFE